MAIQPKATCGVRCPGCPVIPLTSKQVRQLEYDAKHGNPKQVARANQVLRMEVMAFYCLEKEDIISVTL